jgi:hypothetical protein
MEEGHIACAIGRTRKMWLGKQSGSMRCRRCAMYILCSAKDDRAGATTSLF